MLAGIGAALAVGTIPFILLMMIGVVDSFLGFSALTVFAAFGLASVPGGIFSLAILLMERIALVCLVVLPAAYLALPRSLWVQAPILLVIGGVAGAASRTLFVYGRIDEFGSAVDGCLGSLTGVVFAWALRDLNDPAP